MLWGLWALIALSLQFQVCLPSFLGIFYAVVYFFTSNKKRNLQIENMKDSTEIHKFIGQLNMLARDLLNGTPGQAASYVKLSLML